MSRVATEQKISRVATECSFETLCLYAFFQVKYCVLLCGDDDDPEIVKAASGALAMLTSQSAKICKKVFDVSITKT